MLVLSVIVSAINFIAIVACIFTAKEAAIADDLGGALLYITLGIINAGSIVYNINLVGKLKRSK